MMQNQEFIAPMATIVKKEAKKALDVKLKRERVDARNSPKPPPLQVNGLHRQAAELLQTAPEKHKEEGVLRHMDWHPNYRHGMK